MTHDDALHRITPEAVRVAAKVMRLLSPDPWWSGYYAGLRFAAQQLDTECPLEVPHVTQERSEPVSGPRLPEGTQNAAE